MKKLQKDKEDFKRELDEIMAKVKKGDSDALFNFINKSKQCLLEVASKIQDEFPFDAFPEIKKPFDEWKNGVEEWNKPKGDK